MTGHRRKNLKLMRIAGVSGISGSVFVIIMVLLATFVSPWFSWEENALSELGVGEVSLFFNCAVLVGGLLGFFFAFGVKEYLDEEPKVKLGIVSFMLASLCLVFVAVFTIDYPFTHGLVSLGYFLLGPIGLILIGLGTENVPVKKMSFVLGIAALITILVLPIVFLVSPLHVGFAIPELIHSLIVGMWTINMSLKLLSYSF